MTVQRTDRKTASKVCLLVAVIATVSVLFLAEGGREARAYPDSFAVQTSFQGTTGDPTSVDIALHREYRFATWREDNERICFRRSTDRGASWEDPVVLHAGYATGPPVVIAGCGSGENPPVWVFAPVLRGGGGFWQIWIFKSEDHGKTFSPVWWSKSHSDKSEVRVDHYPGANRIAWVHSEVKGGVREVKFGGVIRFDGTIVPYQDCWISPVDGIESCLPDVSCQGYDDCYVAYTNGSGGGYSRQHLRFRYSGDFGVNWSNHGAGHDIVAYDPSCTLEDPKIDWTDNTPVIYCSMKSEGVWSLGRFYWNKGWHPGNISEAIVDVTGEKRPLHACVGQRGTGYEQVWFRNGDGGLSWSLKGADNVSDFFGEKRVLTGSYYTVATLDHAEYSGGYSAVAMVSDDGSVYYRTQCKWDPEVEITNPAASPQTIYENRDFRVESSAVASFAVTSTDVATRKPYVDGIEKVEYFCEVKGGGGYEKLQCTDGDNKATAPDYLKKVNADRYNQKSIKLKARTVDSSGNSSWYTMPNWIVIDRREPRTSMDVEGTRGDDDWYTSEVVVTLSADDYSPTETQYRLTDESVAGGSGNWTTYSRPFGLRDGLWKLEYRSTDAAGNTEAARTARIKVDTQAPVAAVLRPARDTIQTGYYMEQKFRLEGTGTDSNGLQWAGILVDGKLVYETRVNFQMGYVWDVGSVEEDSIHSIEVRVQDEAGNVGSAQRRVWVGNVARDWWFAEGNTLPNFDQWLCIMNPGEGHARVTLDFMLEDGQVISAERSLGPHQRDTVKVKDVVPEGHHVATHVHCDDQAIVVECPIYFLYRDKWKGGHNVMGVNALQREHYFAEGTTRNNEIDGEFEEWLCLMNPSPTDTANVTITYMLGTGENVARTYRVGPHSRHTVEVAGDVGADQDVSAAVLSDVPIATCRPMYFNYHGFARDGSAVVGATGPCTKWTFAEGCTHAGFQEWLCIQNPNQVEAEVQIDYLTATGRVVTAREKVPPRSRHTVEVLRQVGDHEDVSARITSDSPIICERPMYFIYGPQAWDGGESELGNPALSSQYFLAEGTTISDFDTYYTLANPGDDTCDVTIEYVFGTGTTQLDAYEVGPHSRLTINVRDAVQREESVSASITASFPIAVERPMYFRYGDGWTGGHGVCGYGVD